MRMTLPALALALVGSAAAADTRLTLYTSQSPEIAQQTVDKFMEKHPEIKVEWMRNGTSQLINIMAAEREAGGIKADVLLVADAINLGMMKRDGLLLPYPEAQVSNYDPKMYDADFTFFGTKVSSIVIAYNTETAQPVAGWDELMVDANAGQIVAPSPLYSGAALVQLHTVLQDPTMGWDFYKRLNELGVAPEGGNGPALKAVAGGQSKYAFNLDADVLRAKRAGSPVDMVFPVEGTAFYTEPAAIIATTKFPAEAKVLIDFLLSKEGQELASAQGYMPADPTVAGPEGLPPLKDIKLLPLNADKAVETDAEAREAFTAIFGG